MLAAPRPRHAHWRFTTHRLFQVTLDKSQTMKRNVRLLALFLFLCATISTAQSAMNRDASVTVFADKPLAAPHIHVENLAQFVKSSGKPLPQGAPNSESFPFERTRLGTVIFAPDLRVYIDVIRNTVHYPSYFELVDSRSGAPLGKYAVASPEDAHWYFSGNGAAYLNQTHLSLCGPRYTRKLTQKGKGIIEVAQPLVYIGAETDVETTTPLFESATNRTVVATVVPGTKVTVLGLQRGRSELFEMAFLVKTSFGLTGWHAPRGKPDDGRLSIYQCN